MNEQIITHHSIIMEIAIRHPIVGAVTAVILSTGGYFIPYLIEVQLPIIVMQLIQISIWFLAGAASILTIMGYFKRNK